MFYWPFSIFWTEIENKIIRTMYTYYGSTTFLHYVYTNSLVLLIQVFADNVYGPQKKNVRWLKSGRMKVCFLSVFRHNLYNLWSYSSLNKIML